MRGCASDSTREANVGILHQKAMDTQRARGWERGLVALDRKPLHTHTLSQSHVPPSEPRVLPSFRTLAHQRLPSPTFAPPPPPSFLPLSLPLSLSCHRLIIRRRPCARLFRVQSYISVMCVLNPIWQSLLQIKSAILSLSRSLLPPSLLPFCAKSLCTHFPAFIGCNDGDEEDCCVRVTGTICLVPSCSDGGRREGRISGNLS